MQWNWQSKLQAVARRGLPSLRNLIFAQFGYWPTEDMSEHWLELFPVYCISLKRATWRRQVIARQIARMKLKNFQFVDAVDAVEFSVERAAELGLYDPVRSKHWHTDGLSASEIACSLSHAKCYRLIVESNAPRALIIEDDALFRCSRFRQIELEHFPTWADIVFVNAFLSNSPPNEHLDGLLFSDDSYNGSSAGYIVTREAAQRLLEEAVPTIHAADGLLGRALSTKVGEDHWFRSKGSKLSLRGAIVYPEAITNGSTEHYTRSTIR